MDPRAVSVLDQALAHYQVGLGSVEVASDPAHVQELVVTSVGGQAVGPDNFAARDLVTEIAAMDPSVRPDEIGTPWPIQSQGFYSDASSAGSLRLSFEMAGTNASAGEAAGSVGPGAGAGGGPPAVGVQPAAGPGSAPVEPGSAGGTAAAGSAPAGVSYAASTPPPAASPAGLGTAAGSGAGSTPPTAPPTAAGATAAAANELAAAPSSVASAGDPSPQAQAAFAAAKRELGVPYQWGGESPQTGFDCSGLTQWAYHQAGIDIPRVAAEQATVGTPVGINDLKEGDLVFFRIGGGEIDHVGMYVGNHQFIEAPATGQKVQYANLNDPYWASQFAGARRIVALSAAAPATAVSGSAVAETAGAGSSRPVQFLRAVQPGVASATDAAPAQAVGTSPASSQVASAEVIGGTPGQGQPLADQAVGQAQGASAQAADLVPAGGAISVSSPLLTSGQATFAAHLASLTGLSPRVVAAWELAEESGPYAQTRQAATNFNWLNIGYFDSGPGQIAFNDAFKDPVAAAEQTAKFLKGEWGGASASIQAILGSVGKGADAQISAIANSDWASTHYDGGANLRGTFSELADMHVETVA